MPSAQLRKPPKLRHTRDHIFPRGGCPLPPRCSLGADIKLLSNGTSFPFNPLYSHFARWLPWNSSSGGQFLLPGDSALCKHKRILSKSFKASTSRGEWRGGFCYLLLGKQNTKKVVNLDTWRICVVHNPEDKVVANGREPNKFFLQ